ncbi:MULTISPECIES: DUF3892 domain-containing protein [Vibrio]|uniref:DUF3892 domain-containing protein n=1 Tax=Vibrio TaxID=662 RepID=UPI000CE98245|nr:MULTISPECIES: DUF3892 domain-containing protein [Vibrio]ELA9876548.1 DUF3892 domain-containing protein [Vibrio parahaemolyticus]HDY7922643.1 DUF3892 domain-containing protein [Vibrio vulnificus]AVF75859.1 DUF3892 domain-containing protein [Vibrio alginolyticus]ELA9894503.1 DUF3892 domain-containing protein [Vibrio parahaemolyticus]ELB2764060.1 DUF3892 domain-containing protein [Vibrio alginolyticus]
MANNIKGNQDGENGENQTYTIPGRGVVDRETLVQEVEQGKHPNFHTVEVEGDKYVRANPDRSKGNNVDS